MIVEVTVKDNVGRPLAVWVSGRIPEPSNRPPGIIACPSEKEVGDTSFMCEKELGHGGPHTDTDDDWVMTWD